jgi:small subunit ribosomal protein S2
MEKKLQKLETKFGGIKNLERLPDAVFIIDMKKDELAVKEARRKGVKIIAISDTDSDPTLADYPIPANNDAISSVKYILEKVREAILIQKSKVKT